MSRFRNSARAVLVISVLVLSTCVSIIAGVPFSTSVKAAQPTYGGHLRVGYTIEAKTPFNPIRANAIWETYINALVYDSLIQTDANGEFVALIAQSWEISQDGRTLTFHLAGNVSWHDGQPLTSADVEFTLGKFVSESITFTSNLAGIRAPDNTTVTGFKVREGAIETPDANTVIFQLEQPSAPFFYFVGVTPILSKHVLEGQNLAFSDDYINQHVVGSGPFKYFEFVRGSYITLVANENYFLGRPYLDRVTFRVFKSSAAGEIALKARDIDYFALVQPWDVESLETAGLNVQGQSVANVWYMTFNLDKRLSDGSYNPFSDIRVRRAVAHALNLTDMVQSTYLGYGRVGSQPVPPEIKYFGKSYYNETMPNPYYRYDLELANTLLNESGYLWNPVAGNVSNGAKYRFETKLHLWTGYDDIVKNAQWIQAQLQNVGINLVLDVREWIAFLDLMFSSPRPRVWAVHMLGWTQNLDADGIWSAKYYWSEVNAGAWGMNASNYTNTELNRLIEQGRVTVDADERTRIYKRCAYLLAEDLPELIYGYPDRIVSWNPDFKGFVFGMTGAMSVIAGAISPYSLRQVYYQPTVPTTTPPTTTPPTTTPPTTTPAAGLGLTEVAVAVLATAVVAVAVTALVLRRRKS